MIWAILIAWVWGPELVAVPEKTNAPHLVVLNRQISQRDGHWTVDYLLRYEGTRSQFLTGEACSVEYESSVANSRCRPHAVPRRASAYFNLSNTASAFAPVIESQDERTRCRERVELAFERVLTDASETQPRDRAVVSTPIMLASRVRPAKPSHNFAAPSGPLQIDPGETFCVRLNIDHDHFLHSRDPLLGERRVSIRIGACQLFDRMALVEEQTSGMCKSLNEPPDERRDRRQFRSAPDSLYLAADLPGYSYYRFEDIPVRHGTTFRLAFWYLIAVGTEGSCHVRVTEYQDRPNLWYRLDGGIDEQVTTVGKWQKFEREFQTLDETTTIALDFRVSGASVGEFWIDDVELVPFTGAAKSKHAER